MKRAFLCTTVILLVACNRQATEIAPLPAEQVMKNAAQASVLMESASYTMNANFTLIGTLGAVISGEANLEGSLHQSGEHLQLHAKVSANIQDDTGDTSLQADANVIVMGTNQTYLRINDFTSSGEKTILPPMLVTSVRNTWLDLRSDVTTSPAAAVTPDPRLLYAQAQVVRVTSELSPAMIDNRIHYHYAIELDNEKFVEYLMQLSQDRGETFSKDELAEEYQDLHAEGEIWIDAQSFHVRRLLWDISPFVSQTGTSIQAKISANFSDFNNAAPIQAPDNAIHPQDLFLMNVINETGPRVMQFDEQGDIIESLLVTPSP